MMVFPHFLALASLVAPSGEIMLAGDHRQLAPIVAHDWESEDRPPTVVYQPYVSAYEAVDRIREQTTVTISDAAVTRSALTYTFRLPHEIRELIARIYALDEIQLEGRPAAPPIGARSVGFFDKVWDGEKILGRPGQGRYAKHARAEAAAAPIAKTQPHAREAA